MKAQFLFFCRMLTATTQYTYNWSRLHSALRNK